MKPKDVLQAPQQQKRAYASYAEATASDQVSGITDSDPSPRDAKHEELSTRIASLEAMITTLVYQVQQLTSIAPATQGYLQAPNHTEVPYPQGKRQDVKECPEKINDHMIIPPTQKPKKARRRTQRRWKNILSHPTIPTPYTEGSIRQRRIFPPQYILSNFHMLLHSQTNKHHHRQQEID